MSSSRMDSCTVWLEMAAAVKGLMASLPFSNASKDSAMASPVTPWSVGREGRGAGERVWARSGGGAWRGDRDVGERGWTGGGC